jgi:hypothetical protein
VTYYASSKAWMTLEIFRDFLRALDASFGALGRKILLLVEIVPLILQTYPL